MPVLILRGVEKMKHKPMIYVFTGDGGGKTIASLGFAMRAVGQGQKVVMVQFLKGRKDTGEYKIQKKLGQKFRVYQFGGEKLINLNHPSAKDKERAKRGLDFAKKALKQKPDVLILDEINYAVAAGLLKVSDAMALLRMLPNNINVVLTGRRTPKEFIAIADGVSEIIKIKHSFDKGVPARRGVEY